MACMVLAAAAAAGARAETATDSSPVVAACANPRLPAEILDGPVAVPPSPLPVIDATVQGLVLRLAVADDDKTRDLGLMCVTRMKPQHGMIFAFVQNQRWEFWMKNTLVPLDMVWLQPDGTITTIAANVPASTRETPDDAVARRAGIGEYVIELRAGEAAADHLRVGKRIAFEALHARQ
jgi:uncharacterized membrane protein (UPF0127 family)